LVKFGSARTRSRQRGDNQQHDEDADMAVTSIAEKWVEQAAEMTRPSRVVWCDGSKSEYDGLVEGMLRDGTLLPLNSRTYPNCYLHRSHPLDVARTEQLTFICTPEREDVGPTNNWMAPAEAKATAGAILHGAMQDRTMYVIPYLMGPVGCALGRTGIMVTDSAYAAASMHIMTRVGSVAFDHMRRDDDFVGGLHSLADLSPDRRLILHFPDEKQIWSVGSGYGGNALLGKKCHALRIASWQARQEGWLAEHMLIIGVEDPEVGDVPRRGDAQRVGRKTQPGHGRLEAARLARLTVGDDIAWMWVDASGQLRAVNPSAASSASRPIRARRTNWNAIGLVRSNTIFTNVALTPQNEPWWEGLTAEPPPGPWTGSRLMPRAGRPLTPPRASPSRSNSVHRWPNWEDPHGVPISGLIPARGAPRSCPRSRGLRLGPRRLPRLGHEHRDHGRHHREGRCGPPRSDGHDPVLRLQHGRLFRPLAGHGPAPGEAAAHFPRELVPARP
jgi:phosphoenolpyruvate carboxykinase (GTP)